MRRLRHAAIALALTSIALPASAQPAMELGGFGGYTPSVTLDEHSAVFTDLKLRGEFTWGINGTRFLTPHWGAEIVFTQQASALETVTEDGAGDLYRIGIGQLHANLVYQFGDVAARLRPFVFGGAGATFFSARDLESSTKASFGVGGGVKYFPWQTVGLRGQIRYKPTWVNDDPDAAMCDPFGFCQGWLMPIEFTAGVLIRF
jgi:opacity protein-like surface antigen